MSKPVTSAGKMRRKLKAKDWLFVVGTVVTKSTYCTDMIKHLNTTSEFLTFTFPSSVSPFSPSLYSCSELSGGRTEERKHWQESHNLVLNIFKTWILFLCYPDLAAWPTLRSVSHDSPPAVSSSAPYSACTQSKSGSWLHAASKHVKGHKD